MVLTWTLFTELAPHAFVFTDDAGRQISESITLSTTTAYKDATGHTRTVGSAALVFNQRKLIAATTVVLTFYLSLIAFNSSQSPTTHEATKSSHPKS